MAPSQGRKGGQNTGMVDILPHAAVSPRPGVGLWAGGGSAAHLLVHELPGVFLDVAFVEVGGHTHEPNLRQAEVSELDVAERGDEQAVGRWVGHSGLGVLGCSCRPPITNFVPSKVAQPHQGSERVSCA